MPDLHRRLDRIAERAFRLCGMGWHPHEVIMLAQSDGPTVRAERVAGALSRGVRPIVVTIAPPVTRADRERRAPGSS